MKKRVFFICLLLLCLCGCNATQEEHINVLAEQTEQCVRENSIAFGQFMTEEHLRELNTVLQTGESCGKIEISPVLAETAIIDSPFISPLGSEYAFILEDVVGGYMVEEDQYILYLPTQKPEEDVIYYYVAVFDTDYRLTDWKLTHSETIIHLIEPEPSTEEPIIDGSWAPIIEDDYDPSFGEIEYPEGVPDSLPESSEPESSEPESTETSSESSDELTEDISSESSVEDAESVISEESSDDSQGTEEVASE